MAEQKIPKSLRSSTRTASSNRPISSALHANVRDASPYQEAERDYEGFWAKFASELEWSRTWTKVLDWTNPPHAKWFVGGQINASVNCVDRHIRTARRNKAALIWEGEPGDRRTLTYFDLYRQVSAFANVLKSLGVRERRSSRDLHAARSRAGDRDARVRARRCAPQHRVRWIQCGVASRPYQRRAVQAVDYGRWRVSTRRRWCRSRRCSLEAIQGTPSIENVVMLRRIGASPVQAGPS